MKTKTQKTRLLAFVLAFAMLFSQMVSQAMPVLAEEKVDGAEAEKQSVLNDIVFESCDHTMDYENKICTAYIPDSKTTSFKMALDVNMEGAPASASLTYTSGVSQNLGEEITRVVPLDGTALNFSSGISIPTPLADDKAMADMQLKVLTANGTENWTIKLLRESRMTTISAKNAAGKTVSLNQTITTYFEAYNTTKVTDDYVTLTLKPQAYKDKNVYVTVNGERVTTAGTSEGTWTYTLNLDKVNPSTTAIIKAVREGDGFVAKEYKLTINRTRTDNITDITLDQTSVNLTKDSLSAVVEAKVTSAVEMESYDLTWSVENTDIATITADPADPAKAVLTGVADGSTTFKVTDGYVAAEGVVLVEKDKEVLVLSDVVMRSTGVTNSTTNLLEHEIDREKKVITVYTPAWTTSGVYVCPEFTEGKTVTNAVLEWTPYGKEEAMSATLDSKGTMGTIQSKAPYAKDSNEGGTLKMTLTTAAGEEVWTINVVRYGILGDLKIAAGDGRNVNLSKSFSYQVTEYHTSLSTMAETLGLTITRKDAADVIKVNGTPLEVDEETGIGTYDVQLTAGLQKVVISVGAEGNRATEYILYVVGMTPTMVTFVTEPEGAVANVTDINGDHQISNNGVYHLVAGNYDYTVTAKGYVSKKGSFVVEGNVPMTVKEALEAAPANTELKNFKAEWSSYNRNADSNDNNAVTDAATPINSDAVSVKWVKQIGQELSAGATSAGIIVNNRWYGYAGKTLIMVDKDSGEILNSQQMTASTGYQYMPPVYGDGMIFVAQSGGAVEAFNADTLEPLWRYTDSLGGSPKSQMRYDDGYVYVGFYKGSTAYSNFVCISATDEDPTRTDEKKLATWTLSHMCGFYFAGSWNNDDYVYITSDGGGGTFASSPTTSILYCVEKATGNVVQKIPINGDTRGSVVYYDGRLFLTTTTGYTYAFNLTEEGTIDTKNTIEPLYLGGRSTNTPVIYNNRLYFACAAGSVGPYADAGIYVVDINPENGAMSLAYMVPTAGNCQNSGILSTAYYDETGYVYVYFSCNVAAGTIYMVKDKAGLTEADPASGAFWSPDYIQYCLHRLYADENGTLYYTNDASWTYALETTYLGLTNITAEGGNAVVDEGAFDANASVHTILVDPDTETLKLTFTTEPGAEVWINDQTVTADYEVALTEGTATVKAKVVNGKNSRVYTIKIVPRSNDATLQSLLVTEDGTYAENENLSPVFDPETTAYTSTCTVETSSVYVWPVEADKATIAVTAVSGVKDCAEGTALTAVTEDGRNKYEVVFADETSAAVIKMKVTAEDKKTTKEYTLTLKPIDKVSPAATEITTADRKAESVTLSFVSSEEASGYYVVSAADAEAMETTAITENGTKFTTVEGANAVEVKGLGEAAAKVQFVLVDAAGNISAVYSADVMEYISLKGISLDVESAVLNVKNSAVTVTVTLEPETPTEMPKIIWSSSDENIATVQADEDDAKKAVITGIGEGTAVITVTAGAFTKNVTITADMKSVDIKATDITFDNRTETSVEMTVKAPEACTISYVVKAEDAEAPADSEALLADENVQTLVISAEDLENGKMVVLEGLTTDAAKVYFVATDAAGNVTAVLTADIPAKITIVGDVNQDGIVDIFDAALIIDMIKGTEEADMVLGDVDGNGEIDIFDAATVIDIIKAGI